MAKDERYHTLKAKLACADAKHEDVRRNIIRWREYYRGKHWGTGQAQKNLYKSQVTVNMVFSNVRTILPSINFKNPRIFCNPKKKPYTKDGQIFDTIAASAIHELILNYYFRELNMKKQIDSCLLDALLGPWGIMFHGYTLETERVDETNELISNDGPFVMRISPLNFRVDPACTSHDLYDARYIAIRSVKSLREVKLNPRYTNTKNLKPNYTIDSNSPEEDKEYVRREAEKADKMAFDGVELWDIWDKEDKKVYTISKTHDKILRADDWGIEYEHFPVETLWFNENPDQLYPISDVDIYLAEQDELNRIRSMQIDHVRRISSRLYFAREDALTIEEEEKLQLGADGAVIKTKTDPNNAVVPLRDATISQDLYMMSRQLMEDIRMKAGIAQFEQGMAQKFETATEPMLMQQGITIKRDERTAILEDFIKRCVMQVSRILQQTLSATSIPLTNEMMKTAREYAEGKLEKIAGAENSTILLPWLNVAKEDIAGDYDFEIDIGSTRPVSQEMRKRDAIELANLIGSSPYVKPLEGLKRILDAYEVRDMEKLLKTEEEVAGEQQAAAEAAIQAEQAKDMPKRMVDLQKTEMKTQTSKEIAGIKNTGALLNMAMSKSGKSEVG